MDIQPFKPEHLDRIVALSLRAWEPVFASLQASMDEDVFDAFFPDWREHQAKAVADICNAEDTEVWVALDEDSGDPAGFATAKLVDSIMGEITMIAVDPDYQRLGIASALTTVAVDWMREQGATVAMVETGDDPGHGPARQTYEKAGFRKLPVARYFKTI